MAKNEETNKDVRPLLAPAPPTQVNKIVGQPNPQVLPQNGTIAPNTKTSSVTGYTDPSHKFN